MPEASFVNLILPWPENSVYYSYVETISKFSSENFEQMILLWENEKESMSSKV